MYIDPKARKKQLHPEFSQAMIFVFDWSEIATFNIVTDYIEAFNRIEVRNLYLSLGEQA
jgi:hypothetical protein